MDKFFEKLWVSIYDSHRFRQFVNTKIGAKIFKSDSYQQLRLIKNSISTKIACMQQPDYFEVVDTFVFFIGHNKSGTSMIGSLLDAHPKVIIADEVGAIDFLNAGFTRDQVFHLLLKGSRREFMKGRVTARRLTPYSYLVPDQWQGQYRTLKVIGDGKAGSTTNLLANHPLLLSQLPALVNGSKIKIIQTIRNPFDVISVMMVRGKRSFENSIAYYFSNCEILEILRSQLDKSNLFPIRYEEFVKSPRKNLCLLCEYLGIEPLEDYLDSCTSIIHHIPVRHWNMVKWETKWIRMVEEKIKDHDFLKGYSLE